MNQDESGRIVSQLEEGERLLWAGRPARGAKPATRWELFWGGVALIIVAAASCGAFAYVQFTTDPVPEGFGVLRALPLVVCVPYLAVGIYFLLAHRVMAAGGRGAILCGITDRNLILVSGSGDAARVQRLPLAQVRELGIKGFDGGFIDADMVVGSRRARTKPRPAASDADQASDAAAPAKKSASRGARARARKPVTRARRPRTGRRRPNRAGLKSTGRGRPSRF